MIKTECNLVCWNLSIRSEKTVYKCKQRDYNTISNENLLEHVQAVHELIKYNCKQRDNNTIPNENLWEHVQAVHELIK